jgi:diamine N-acetyltransferase
MLRRKFNSGSRQRVGTKIRKLNQADAAKLAQLARVTYVAAFGHTFSEDDLSAYISKRLSDQAILTALDEDVFLGAVREGELVGFVQFGVVRLDSVNHTQSDQELRRLYVLADFQRKGVGSSLMKAALQHHRLSEASHVYLDVWERNASAIALYKRFGFDVIGHKRFVLPSGAVGDADLIMVRRSKSSALKPGGQN